MVSHFARLRSSANLVSQYYMEDWRSDITPWLGPFLTAQSFQAVLRASLSHSSLSVEKFSRWLRAICSIILARGTAEDRMRAIGYIEQGVSVMGDHHEDVGQEEVNEVLARLFFNTFLISFIVSARRTPVATCNLFQYRI